MKNLAIIGASYLQLPLIQKAKRMGFITHVFAWKANDVGEKEADYFYPISIVEVDKIANKCEEIGICGVCSIASDLANITVNYVGNKLGLVCNSVECNSLSTNKYLMRKAFYKNEVPCPQSVLINNITDLSEITLNYPVIVKPTDRSGSRGICKVFNYGELKKAVLNAMTESFEKKVLVEEFAEGQEYSVESISYKGQHKVLAITLKYTTGAPNFIETGHLEPAPLDKHIKEKIERVVLNALDSLKILYGASHSELKIDSKGNIKIIEIGSRMGGDCIGSDLVYYSTGIVYLKAVIDVACGLPPNLESNNKKCVVEVRFILNKNDLELFEKIKKDAPEHILKIVKEPNLSLLGKTSDSSNRAGCYIINLNGS